MRFLDIRQYLSIGGNNESKKEYAMDTVAEEEGKEVLGKSVGRMTGLVIRIYVEAD